ncbi:MAG: response regulator [Desulfobacteraceae bacterium]|nr:MAG: response regulator [Desulfobacteraceae bacterium]
MNQNELPRLLVVEDDIRLAQLIRDYLQGQGFQVHIEGRGDKAAKRILTEKPDLVILDLMLPGQDGLSICQSIRADFPGPILILTAREEDMDQVAGLELGADDYVKKPVEPRVLLARIRALFRRYRKTAGLPESEDPEEHAFGRLRVNRVTRSVYLEQKAVDLTTNEFDLLWFLVCHAGDVLDRDAILSAIRGISYDGLDRSVDVGISRLRKKLGDDSENPFRIKTVWGRGYLFSKESWG